MLFLLILGTVAAVASARGQEAQQSREAGAQVRLPRQQARTSAALDGTVRSVSSAGSPLPVPGATLQLQELSSHASKDYSANGEGVFRIFPLAPGDYSLQIQAEGYAAFLLEKISLHANEVLTLEILLIAQPPTELRSRLPRLSELGPPLPSEAAASAGSYREFRHRLDADPSYVLNPAPESLPPAADVFATVPDRWALQQPEYRRYAAPGEYIYTRSRWYDPFNRNRLKGDEPIWPEHLGQQVFLNLTAISDTIFDERYVPSPSNVSAANPGSSAFFGNGEQEFVDQTLRFTLDLFHGDASFKPVDWRIR
ncbi:MAG TPA: carboxypeptidase-like regulatory domain-containing protein, partial [Candidatus Acidoferrum sp.]